MALIIDPDLLADSATNDGSQEVFINTTAKTIKLNEVGNLSADGVTVKAVYSFLKEEWIADSFNKNLMGFWSPMQPITDEFYELVEGWNWADQATRNLLRRGGFLVRDTSGNVTEHWAGVAILGAEPDDQIYYDTGAGATNFIYAGNTAEVVQVISDPNGDGSYVDGFNRSTNLTGYNRQQGQVYSSGSTTANGEASLLAPKLFSITLNTGDDLKIITADTGIKASGTGYPADVVPYDGMSITYHATPQARTLQGGSYNFGVIIDGNGQSLQEVYEFVQYALRQTADIDADAGSVIGKTAAALLRYVGDTLYTTVSDNSQGGGTGVFIDDFDSADTNSVFFVDNTGTERQYPYTARLTFNFSDTLVSDGSAEYTAYYATMPVVARLVSDAAITASDGTLTSATAAFVATDKDASVIIEGAGAAGVDLTARIVSVTNGTTVEITPNASTTVTGSDLNILGGDWGEAGAVIVKDDTGTPMTGLITATPVAVDYDYDGNTQGGRTAGTDANIVVVASGLSTAQYVRATGTIERSKTNSVTLVSPLERNYDNP